MKSARPSRFFWLLLGGFPVLVCGFVSMLAMVYYALAVTAEAYTSTWPLPCATPTAARAAGSFIDTVLVEPRTVRHAGYTLVFDTCWVEQQRESRRPAWYARRTVQRLPQAQVRLRYHVEHQGAWPLPPAEPPLLNSPSNYGSVFLDSVGTYTLPLDLLPDDYYGGNLPLELSLTAVVGAPPVACFTVMPAHAYRAQP